MFSYSIYNIFSPQLYVSLCHFKKMHSIKLKTLRLETDDVLWGEENECTANAGVITLIWLYVKKRKRELLIFRNSKGSHSDMNT